MTTTTKTPTATVAIQPTFVVLGSTTPDLLTVFDEPADPADELRYFEVDNSRREPDDAVAGFEAAFEWARSQNFEPDHAQRMRREAWRRSESG